jgi:hypothetical protein
MEGPVCVGLAVNQFFSYFRVVDWSRSFYQRANIFQNLIDPETVRIKKNNRHIIVYSVDQQKIIIVICKTAEINNLRVGLSTLFICPCRTLLY